MMYSSTIPRMASYSKRTEWELPGGLVVKIPPSNTGDRVPVLDGELISRLGH